VLLNIKFKLKEQTYMAHGIQDIEKSTRNELATVFGVHPSTVSRWVARDGCPRNPDGTFDLRKVFFWRIEENDLEPAPCENEEAQRWMTEFRRERALLAKIERRRSERELISKKDVATLWAKRLSNLAHSLNGLIDRLPPLLEGKSRSEIGSILKTEIWVFRMAYSQKARYTPQIAQQIKNEIPKKS
jgi:phage terminase Nu1 subunit (DNA packaging protein)